MQKLCLVALSVVVAGAAGAQPQRSKSGDSLIQQAIHAEQQGDTARAYLLWAQAAIRNPEVWAKARALKPGSETATASAEPVPETPFDAGLIGSVTSRDLEEIRRMAAPPRLAPNPALKTFHLRGDIKTLYETVARDFGYVAVIDRELLQNSGASQIRFDVENVNYRDAIHLIEAATNTFAVAVSNKVFLVASDTQQKRNDFEPAVVQAFLIPQRTSVQDAQELMMAVQQTLEIRRSVLDPGKRMILLRGPYSRVMVAQALLHQMMNFKPQVSVEIELVTFAENKSRSWGLGLMTSTNLVNFGQFLSNVKWANPASSATTGFLGLGGGATYLGIGLTAAHLFANATDGEARTMIRSEIVVNDGQAATFHVGDKYPIITSQYSGFAQAGQKLSTPIPSFNFEDLGLVLKVTPAIHSMEEVSLDVEAEFKAIGGSGYNGIPIINDRKLQSKVRLSTADWAVVAGLMSRSEAYNISGIAGLSTLPVIGRLFRDTTKSTDFSEALILIKPKVLSMPPGERIMGTFWVGSETRWPTLL